ncbi:MAG: hypothetical protein AAFV19_07620 [Pseudomonadota bacterium]
MSAPVGSKIETPFDFYAQQYFAHLSKVRELHNERTAMMRYSVIGTFAYYAWLFNNGDFLARHADDYRILVPVWIMPMLLNWFGLWRNRILLQTIDKHGGFLGYLAENGLGTRNYFAEYKEELKKSQGFSQPRMHHSRIFWKAILVICFIAGLVGMTTISKRVVPAPQPVVVAPTP